MTKEFKSDPDAILTSAQAAEILGFTEKTLTKWRLQGNGPKYAKVNNKWVRYRRCDLDAWIASKIVHSTAEEKAGSM